MPAELLGQGGLQLRLRAIGPALRVRMQSDMTQALQVMYQTAFENAPVDTGWLRGSMSGTVLPGEARLWAPARYAGFQEYGTSRNRPQPFMRPAFQAGVAYLQARGYRPV